MRKPERHCLLRLACAAALCLLLCPRPGSALEHELIISVYQGPCADGDFDTNLSTARRVVGQALERGSHFLALPETFLSGYDTPEHMRAGARRVDDPQLAKFIAETAGHEMVVLVGLARLTDEGIYNSVLVIHRGKLLGTYDKTMLTEGDRDELKFLPGTRMPVFTAHGAAFAVIICHDSSFLHPAMIARLQGAEILFSPHYNSIGPQSVDDHRKWVRNCHVGLACQLRMVVARSNVTVTDKLGDIGYGQSFILSPQGEALAEAELFKTELITARIGPEMFDYPYVWADWKELPSQVLARLAGLLQEAAGK
ncbi:MAG: carbon-nitrogen hydrolase family protein [Candidatus Glassbacteria bacterium]|nr:carbon-nitrogen hydrolase family protein [Candidatus Glassbacteria bacterium]